MNRMDVELEHVEQIVLKMGLKVIHQHDRVLDILKQQDKEKELQIMKNDEYINLLEEEINDVALTALALLSPVASDLRRVIAGIKIASELERIGDYAKNTAIFFIKTEEPMKKEWLEYAIEMEQTVIEMLKKTMQAYEAKDTEAAFAIPQEDQNINQLYAEVKQFTQKADENIEIKELFAVNSMFRNMERSGDHIKNICEHILYMLKGQYYDFG